MQFKKSLKRSNNGIEILIMEMEFGDFMLIMSPIFPKPWNCRKLFISLRQAS